MNVGYTFAGAGIPDDIRQRVQYFADYRPSNQVNYIIGADYAPSDRFTIAGDMVGWTKEHAAVFTPDVLPGATFYLISPDSVTSIYGAVGAKVNVARLWLVSASVLFPLHADAVKAGVTPVVGFERSF